MKCPLCGHEKSDRHGKTSKGAKRTVLKQYLAFAKRLEERKPRNGLLRFCPKCKQTFTDTFDPLCDRRQVSEEDVRIVVQSHAEGSSLRGISRISGLAYDTVVSIVRSSAEKAQMVHNASVQNVDPDAVAADELWSFVETNKNTAGVRN